ncbi:MAG: PPC domain-containing DNA-binding protein [Leptolyngbyaceae bacterium]|nr:PPC domain-containing DNA-binding protein [Leptolyngbyaceae bacterium]
MHTIAIRLHPGDDLKRSLIRYCTQNKISAAFILSCVGSLTHATIRFANQAVSETLSEKLEIITLSGTLSQHGAHLHIAVSDCTGKVTGGHLMENTYIYTTGEIVLGVLPATSFKRELDQDTGYQELAIFNNNDLKTNRAPLKK